MLCYYLAQFLNYYRHNHAILLKISVEEELEVRTHFQMYLDNEERKENY